jgi:muconolactone delta-isomerase
MSQRDISATVMSHRDNSRDTPKEQAMSAQTFMVVATLRDDTDPGDLEPLRTDEQKQLEVLRSAGRIGAHYISPARRATFLEVIAADPEQVTETLESLPFARFFETDIYPTTAPDAAEAAHRARS